MVNRTLFEKIKAYAADKELVNTLSILRIYQNRMRQDPVDKGIVLRLNHGLNVCRLLIDLQVEASVQEEDTAFAAALCRGLTTMDDRDPEDILALCLSPRVFEITHLIGRDVSEEEKPAFYARIQEDQGALLVLLADRAAFLAKLHELSIEESREQVRETRMYFFSMCIYAMEHYPKLAPTISILKGKIKCMCEVSDILTDHFQAREQELSVEILRVREDNAGLRARISALQRDCRKNDRT